jgi:predicted amidophosphoribosyltransferase
MVCQITNVFEGGWCVGLMVRAHTPQPCPTCGKDMRYIQQYDRWYCDNCKAYK